MKHAGALSQIARKAVGFIPESRAARGALLGAGAGAVAGGVNAGVHGDSIGHGAIRGGLGGAAIGGTAGGLSSAYRDAKVLNPGFNVAQNLGETARRMGRGLKQFGQRQIHGFTGAYGSRPGEIGLHSAANAKDKIHLATKRMEDSVLSASPERAKAIRAAHGEHVKNLTAQGARGQESLEAGATSLPGLVRGFAKHPGRTGKALWNESTHGGPAATAMALGLPVALGAPSLARGDESATGGANMRQKLVRLGTGVAGGVLTGGVPVIPQAVGMSLADYAGERITKVKRPGLTHGLAPRPIPGGQA